MQEVTHPLLNLERLGSITAELSSSLVRSIVLPGGLLRRGTMPGAERSGAVALEKGPAIMPGQGGLIVLAPGWPANDDVIVEIIHLAGGRKQKIVVVPAASAEFERTGEEGARFFRRFGVESVEVLPVVTRERADSPYWADKLIEAAAVVLVGNEPLLLREVLEGTTCHEALKAMQAQGKLLAGLGGGAVALGERMLTGPGEGSVPGLALVPRLLLASPGDQAGTVERLLGGLAEPGGAGMLAAGLPAAGAVVVREHDVQVRGEGSAVFIDGRDALITDGEAAEAPCSLCGLRLHVLGNGYSLNMKTRRPVPPQRPAATQSAGA